MIQVVSSQHFNNRNYQVRSMICQTRTCTNIIIKGQIGFRSKHRSTDHIINKYFYDKKKKINFVNFKKAFDSILHEELFSKLQENNINGNLLQLIKATYKQSKCAIKINQQLTHLFSNKKGIRQGDPLSPCLISL